jgi:hypothetical protein
MKLCCNGERLSYCAPKMADSAIPHQRQQYFRDIRPHGNAAVRGGDRAVGGTHENEGRRSVTLSRARRGTARSWGDVSG